MTRLARWGFALVLLPLAACGGGGEEAATAAAAPAPAPPPLSAADTNFINAAATSGMTEVQAAQLAAQRASRPAVKEFAQQLVTDHTQLNQQLMQLAQRKGVTPPAQPDQSAMQSMQRMRGRGFDRQFLRHEVADHQQALQLFQQEAQQGSDPDVKAFAQQAIPVLQQHLSTAQSLEGGRPMSHQPPAKKEM
jgi:putative membrane protein